MRPVERTDAGTGDGATVCTACPMLCDDVAVGRASAAIAGSASIERACEHGRRAIATAIERHSRATQPGGESLPEAMIDGRGASRTVAMGDAVGLLAGARRVLVTGLADATLAAQRLAALVAERLGGGFDTGSRDGRLLTGPSIARAGEVTAQWEELRDRADLALLWFADPAASHPRFVERFLTSGLVDRPRTVLSVGPLWPSSPDGGWPSSPDGVVSDHVVADVGDAVELARRVEAEDDTDPRAARILAAFGAARCTAIITGVGDIVGLERWAVARLVRHRAHRGPAFEIPLGSGILAGGGNVAGAAAVATWRHGASGAIARACDRGGRFEPAEADGERLVARGEVDLVLVVGGLSKSMRRAVSEATRGVRGPDVVWIGAEPDGIVPGTRRTVFVRSASTLLASEGQMLREDGRLVTLRPLVVADSPSLEAVLGQLLDHLGGDAREVRP